MRYVTIVGSGLLLSAALFSSCTCHRQVSQPPAPTTFEAPPSGFHASGPKITPQTHVQASAATPALQTPPAQVAAAPTPAAEVPPDFPPDVPIFKDAAVAQVQDLANQAHNVVFSTAAPIDDVYKFYQDRMTKGGWQVTQQVQRSSHAFISFKKGNMVANLTVAEDPRNPGRQVIAIMYEEEKPLDFDEF